MTLIDKFSVVLETVFSLIEIRRALGMLKADSTDLFNSTELFGNAPCLISKLILKYT